MGNDINHSKSSELAVMDEAKPGRWSLSRRQWMERMFSGVAAGAAFPALAQAHPIRKHLASPLTVERAEAQAAAVDWTPEFLDSHQVETLAALAERLVPGSTRAQSERFIDTLLSVDSFDNQQRFLNSLAALEGEAIKRFARPFKDLTEAQQIEILTDASKPAGGGPDAQAGPRRRGAFGPPAFGAMPESPTLHDHFENLKGWVSGAYYSSEIGMKELGWTGDYMFESFPGCPHPGGHV